MKLCIFKHFPEGIGSFDFGFIITFAIKYMNLSMSQN
jgi:hypothetical protein